MMSVSNSSANHSHRTNLYKNFDDVTAFSTTVFELDEDELHTDLLFQTDSLPPIDYNNEYIEQPVGTFRENTTHHSLDQMPYYQNIGLEPQPVKKSRGGARVPIFDGEIYEFPVERLLTLDSSGIPILASPILKYGASQGWSTEALLKQATIGQYNTAVRYWFKGQNLSRQSVLEGAAVIVEWFEALEHGRARRNTAVNMTSVPELLRKLAASSKSRRVTTGSKRRVTVSGHSAPSTSSKQVKLSDSSVIPHMIVRNDIVGGPLDSASDIQTGDLDKPLLWVQDEEEPNEADYL